MDPHSPTCVERLVGACLLSLVVAVGGCAAGGSGQDADTSDSLSGDSSRDGSDDRDATPGDSSGDAPDELCDRRVLAGQVTNARDLAGWSVGGGGVIGCRRVLRGGDLSSLGDEGCAELERLGVKTVVDLRQTSTQASAPDAACVTKQAAIVSAPMPKLLPPTRETYLALLEERAAVATMFGALGQPEAFPAYVHCVIGRDRASFAAALVLLALGASRESVVEEFELSNEAGVPVEAEWIEAVLDELESRGGIGAYLDSAGVAPAVLEVLRTRALAR